MERLVKFHLMCPRGKVGLLMGQKQTNIDTIRRETKALICTKDSARYTIVTISAVEKLENGSPAIDAAMAIHQYCLERTPENFKMLLLVEGLDRNGLGEELFGQWSQQTLTAITLSERNQDTIVEFLGGNHGIRNALSLFLTNLRRRETMERLVKFHLICPNSKVQLLMGQDQTNIDKIRRETKALICTKESAGNMIVTVSAVEKLENRSAAIDAALAILQYCLVRTRTRENFKMNLLVEGLDRNGLGEELFGQWSQQTLTAITLSERNQDTIVEFLGGNHGIRNALSLFLRNLRRV